LLNRSLNPLKKTTTVKKPSFDLMEYFKSKQNGFEEVESTEYVHMFEVSLDDCDNLSSSFIRKLATVFENDKNAGTESRLATKSF